MAEQYLPDKKNLAKIRRILLPIWELVQVCSEKKGNLDARSIMALQKDFTSDNITVLRQCFLSEAIYNQFNTLPKTNQLYPIIAARTDYAHEALARLESHIGDVLSLAPTNYAANEITLNDIRSHLNKLARQYNELLSLAYPAWRFVFLKIGGVIG